MPAGLEAAGQPGSPYDLLSGRSLAAANKALLLSWFALQFKEARSAAMAEATSFTIGANVS